jgi:hypothetical protein
MLGKIYFGGMMKRNVWVVLGLLVSLEAVGECRIWTDKNGNSVEAEFVCMSAGKVVIRDKDGRQYRFAPTKLSAADQEFLKTSIPPEIEIVFSKRQDRRNKDYSYSAAVDMSGSIEVVKKNREPYAKEMKVVFMMVGEDQRAHNYIMLDRVEREFDFKTTKSFELAGNKFRMHEDKYDNSYGTEYVGYLAVVLDDSGVIICRKSSRNDFEEYADRALKLNTGDRFSKKFMKEEKLRSY